VKNEKFINPALTGESTHVRCVTMHELDTLPAVIGGCGVSKNMQASGSGIKVECAVCGDANPC